MFKAMNVTRIYENGSHPGSHPGQPTAVVPPWPDHSCSGQAKMPAKCWAPGLWNHKGWVPWKNKFEELLYGHLLIRCWGPCHAPSVPRSGECLAPGVRGGCGAHPLPAGCPCPSAATGYKQDYASCYCPLAVSSANPTRSLSMCREHQSSVSPLDAAQNAEKSMQLAFPLFFPLA